MKRGLQFIISGIITISIVAVLQSFLFPSTCAAVYNKFIMFTIIMNLLGVGVIVFGLYTFLSESKIGIKRKRKK